MPTVKSCEGWAFNRFRFLTNKGYVLNCIVLQSVPKLRYRPPYSDYNIFYYIVQNHPSVTLFTVCVYECLMNINTIMSPLGQQDIRKLKTNRINISFMFNISLYTYVHVLCKRFGSHLSHHQCEMFEENVTQVTGYATAHILQTIQV